MSIRIESPGESALLSPAERRKLLEDIERIGLALGRQLQAPHDAQGSLPLSPQEEGPSRCASAPLARLALLQTLWPNVKCAVLGILRQMDSGLVSTTVLCPLAQSRGLPRTGGVLARTPQGANAWHAAAGRKSIHAHYGQQSIPEDRLQNTIKTPANRFIAAFLTSIQTEAEALAQLAAFCDAGVESELAQNLANDASLLLSRLPFHAMAPLDRIAAHRFYGTGQLKRCSPPYVVLSGLWEKLASALYFDWSGSPLLRLPALDSWHLYEIWCFLQTAASLAESGWKLAAGDAIRWHASGLRLELMTGQSSCLCFTRAENSASCLELIYQPYFASANRIALHNDTGQEVPPYQVAVGRCAGSRGKQAVLSPNSSGISGIRSRSHVMQPDIALQFQGRLFLLDAKFRDYASPGRLDEGAYLPERFAYDRSGALLEDVDKMHTYRDALHRNSASVVEAAWCLFPGAPDAREIFAYPESRPENPFGTAGVGAVRLRPGQSNTWLAHLLASWLS